MEPLHGSSGDEALDSEAQQSLIESSLEQAFAEYDYACAHGLADPVIFLIDCEDEIGSPIARAWEGDDSVDAAILENLGRADAAAEAGDAEDADDPANPAGTRPGGDSRLITTLARAYSLADCR